MSYDVYEMGGSVRVQGRPGVKSSDGVNWCYPFTFLANCSSPICDMSIETEDTGSPLLPGVFALNPDINPQEPDEDAKKKGVKPGIKVERGTFAADGSYKPEAAQNQGKSTREKIDGKEPDKSKSADEVKLKFEPCIEKGKALRITLCFDEPLDENDYITFIPSFADGSSPQSGDAKPATAITLTDLLKILGQIGGAVVPMLGKRQSNEKKRETISRMFAENPKLAKLAPIADNVALADVIRRAGGEQIARELKNTGLSKEVMRRLEKIK